MSETPNIDEIKCFMRCREGRGFLRGIRNHLKGRSIEDVRFRGHEAGITTTLVLDNGETYTFNDEELWLETLRKQFSGLFRELARHNSEECLMDNACNLRKGGIR